MGAGEVPHFVPREDLTSQAAVNFWLLDRKRPKEFTDLQMRTNVVGSLVFRTREGGVGVLVFLGRSDNPPGVKFRYKLVQNAGKTPPMPTAPPAFGPVVERVVNDTFEGKGNEADRFPEAVRRLHQERRSRRLAGRLGVRRQEVTRPVFCIRIDI